jgi:hypothetical protein
MRPEISFLRPVGIAYSYRTQNSALQNLVIVRTTRIGIQSTNVKVIGIEKANEWNQSRPRSGYRVFITLGLLQRVYILPKDVSKM